jgi:hypothetical protein
VRQESGNPMLISEGDDTMVLCDPASSPCGIALLQLLCLKA